MWVEPARLATCPPHYSSYVMCTNAFSVVWRVCWTSSRHSVIQPRDVATSTLPGLPLCSQRNAVPQSFEHHAPVYVSSKLVYVSSKLLEDVCGLKFSVCGLKVLVYESFSNKSYGLDLLVPKYAGPSSQCRRSSGTSVYDLKLNYYWCVMIYCHSKVFMVQATRLCNLMCGLGNTCGLFRGT